MQAKLTYKRSSTPYLVAYIRAKPNEFWDESRLPAIVEKFTAAVVGILSDMDWEPTEGNVDVFIPQGDQAL